MTTKTRLRLYPYEEVDGLFINMLWKKEIGPGCRRCCSEGTKLCSY